MEGLNVNAIWMAGLIGIGVAYGIAYLICGNIGKSRGITPPKTED